MTVVSCVASLSVVVLLVQYSTALQWSSELKNGQVVYACANRDVTLPWTYQVGPGDVISSTEWYFEGRSEELVAASVHGNFFPTPAFAERVTYVPDAGITLRHVTHQDAGNYTVRVTGHDSSSAVSFTLSLSAVLHVADDLRTTDNDLHASDQALVEYNNSTGQWQAVLTCGQFTFGNPPVWVDWLTPEGKTVPSTVYSQGFFKLFLPNPLTEGNYTCMISASTQQASCGQGQARQASVEVNGFMVRLAMMEARLEKLQAESARKDVVIRELTTILGSIQTGLASHATPHIAFSAIGSRSTISTLSVDPSNTLILPEVLFNVGDAYSNGTGRFTAPVAGVYHFSAVTAAHGATTHANMRLRSTSAAMGQYLFFSYGYTGSDAIPQSAPLQGMVRLAKGEQVWLESFGYTSYYWVGAGTSFSGFLLFAE